MIFNKERFYEELNVILNDRNTLKTESFFKRQLDDIENSVMVGQGCSSCGYGSIEGENINGCGTDTDVKWLEQRTLGIVTVLNEMGCFYRDTNKLNNALETFQKAENELRDNNMTHTLDYVQVVMNLAENYKVQKDYNNAIKTFNKAEEFLNKFHEIDYYTYASLYNNVALVYQELKNFNKAAEFLEKSISYIRKSTDHKNELAVTLSNLSMVYHNMKRSDEAIKAIDESISILYEEKDTLNPSYAGILNTRAMFSYYEKDYKKAAEMFELAIEIIKKIYGKNKEYIIGCKNLSHTYGMLGNKEKADYYASIVNN